MSQQRTFPGNQPFARPDSGEANILHEMFAEAVRAHQAGRLEEAKNTYLRVLAKDVKHAESLHGIGLVACQLGNQEVGASMIRRAISVDASNAAFHSSLGAALKTLGRCEEALAAYRHALSLKPKNEETCFHVASLLRDQGKFEDAQRHYERALRLRPDRADTQHNLGVVLQAQGMLEEATECYGHATRLDPNFAASYSNLGTILFSSGRFEEARTYYERALAINPEFADAYNGLGATLLELGNSDEAIACHQRALAIRGDDAKTLSNLGNVFRRQGNLEGAKTQYERALAIDPELAEAHSNLGNVLQNQCRLDEARFHFDRALQIEPDFVDARWNRSLLDLLQGDLTAGWEGFEVRHLRRKIAPRKFAQPQWKGEPLDGKTILLHSEQGLGDTIQFLRYVPMVEALGGKVILHVPSAFRRLAAQMRGLVAVTAPGESLPEFDLHCPLMSLPLAFRTTLDSIPNHVPYLTVPEEALHAARTLFERADDKLRVGISWSGNPNHLEDRFRSIPFELLAPMFSEDRVKCFSLQIDQASSQLISAHSSIVDLKDAIHDFADTAAIMTHLDLVITVDTSVAHLAGALGRPTFVMIPFAPDWRWLTDREDSPWYPTLKLFRQPQFRDWKSVLDRVHFELIQLADQRNGRIPSAWMRTTPTALIES